MSRPPRPSVREPTSLNLHNSFPRNELRNDKKILTSHGYRTPGLRTKGMRRADAASENARRRRWQGRLLSLTTPTFNVKPEKAE